MHRRAEGTVTDGGSEDESTKTKERKERHADEAITDVAWQGEKESKEENRERGGERDREKERERENEKAGKEGGRSTNMVDRPWISEGAHGVTHAPHLAIRARASSLIK